MSEHLEYEFSEHDGETCATCGVDAIQDVTNGHRFNEDKDEEYHENWTRRSGFCDVCGDDRFVADDDGHYPDDH